MLGALVQYYSVGYPAVGALVLLLPSGGCSGSPDPGVVHPSPSLQSHQQSLAYNNTRVASGWLVGATGNKQGAGGLVGFCGLASCGFSLFSFSYKQTEASFINSHFMGGLSVVHNHKLIAAAVLYIEPENLHRFCI